MVASYQHEKELQIYLDELRSQGWRTIRLSNKSPDGIAVKDNWVVAIEILISGYNGLHHSSAKNKCEDYSMFDEIFVRRIKRSKDRLIERKDFEYKAYALARKQKDEEKIKDSWSKWSKR
jgi:hypothetical protein